MFYTYDATGQILGVANYHKGELISLYGYAYDSRGNIVTEKIRLVEETRTVMTYN